MSVKNVDMIRGAVGAVCKLMTTSKELRRHLLKIDQKAEANGVARVEDAASTKKKSAYYRGGARRRRGGKAANGGTDPAKKEEKATAAASKAEIKKRNFLTELIVKELIKNEGRSTKELVIARSEKKQMIGAMTDKEAKEGDWKVIAEGDDAEVAAASILHSQTSEAAAYLIEFSRAKPDEKSDSKDMTDDDNASASSPSDSPKSEDKEKSASASGDAAAAATKAPAEEESKAKSTSEADKTD